MKTAIERTIDYIEGMYILSKSKNQPDPAKITEGLKIMLDYVRELAAEEKAQEPMTREMDELMKKAKAVVNTEEKAHKIVGTAFNKETLKRGFDAIKNAPIITPTIYYTEAEAIKIFGQNPVEREDTCIQADKGLVEELLKTCDEVDDNFQKGLNTVYYQGVFARVRGIVSKYTPQESLAELADRKGVRWGFVKGNGAEIMIFITESKARQYLNSLEDGKI